MLLYGKNSIKERLRVNPRTVKRIFLEESFDDPSLSEFLRKQRIPLKRVSRRELFRIKPAEKLQGIIAEVSEFEYTPLEDFFRPSSLRPSEADVFSSARPTVVFLDRIEDPQNLGGIIRTAACFGGFGLVLPRHHSCQVNETVLHVASGGENYVPIALVTNLSAALQQAKKAGYWIAGSTVRGGSDIRSVSLPFPLALVLGSEGKGMRQGLDKLLELKLSLPMSGAPLSFNVAIACAMFCYEITRQRVQIPTEPPTS